MVRRRYIANYVLAFIPEILKKNTDNTSFGCSVPSDEVLTYKKMTGWRSNCRRRYCAEDCLRARCWIDAPI